MKKEKFIALAGKTGCLLGATALIALTGCVGEVDAGYGGYVGPDDYVYYPGYEMYYGVHSHEWYYRDHDQWVGHPAPHGVSADALRSAPSVHMTFHDNPGAHHAEVVKEYPHNWTPSGKDRDHH